MTEAQKIEFAKFAMDNFMRFATRAEFLKAREDYFAKSLKTVL